MKNKLKNIYFLTLCIIFILQKFQVNSNIIICNGNLLMYTIPVYNFCSFAHRKRFPLVYR